MEMPSLSKSNYSNTVSGAAEWLSPEAIQAKKYSGSRAFEEDVQVTGFGLTDVIVKAAQRAARQPAPAAIPQAIRKEPEMSARIVKVYIADPDTNLPLASRILYSGEEKLTELTDQELFFEVPIAELLAKHNAIRTSTLDKRKTTPAREVFLEPARIRDLKMVVVSIAEF